MRVPSLPVSPMRGMLMNEERKQAILFAVSLLCARKLMDRMDSDKLDFAKQFWEDGTIREAVIFWSESTYGGRVGRFLAGLVR